MRLYVVDTNVAVIANGKSEQASPKCVDECSKHIGDIVEKGVLVIDDKWLILKEYMKNLRSEGQPGVGDQFLKWALTVQRDSRRCKKTQIHPKDSSMTDFEEFPDVAELKTFDRNDRKFVAVAISHKKKPPISQAHDSKWKHHSAVLKKCGVIVHFLCSQSSGPGMAMKDK